MKIIKKYGGWIVGVILEIIVNRLIDKYAGSEYDPIRKTIFSAGIRVFATALPSFIVLFFLELCAYNGNWPLATDPILEFAGFKFGLGHVIGILLLALGIAVSMRLAHSLKEKFGLSLMGMLLLNEALNLASPLVGEAVGGGAIGWIAEFLASLGGLIFTTSLIRVVLSHPKDSSFVSQYGSVNQAIALGVMIAGLYLWLRTETEADIVWQETE